MSKFIFKIINKIRDWAEIQARRILELSIKSLCNRITNKYRDIKLRCYYNKLNTDLFIIHVDEIHANNTGFKEFVGKELNEFNSLFPDITVCWGHYNPVDAEYYDVKKDKIIYTYNERLRKVSDFASRIS